MGFGDWVLSTLSAGALVTGAIFLAKNLITTRLTKAVQHEFDAKLADVSTRLRKSEEEFKADLRRKEAEILALQTGVMNGRVSRLAAVDKRRLEAVDQIWAAVHGLAYAKGASAWMAVAKFEALSKELAKNPAARNIFAAIDTDVSKAQESIDLAQRARPFVSQIAWAYYYAYQSIVLYAVTQIHMLKIGLDAPHLLNSKNVISLINTALPHYTEHMEKHGVAAAHYLLDQLEQLLLDEIRRMLDGAEADISGVQRAKEILREAERLSDSLAQAQRPLVPTL